MSLQSPRRRSLRRFTWVVGAASMIAGAAIYVQVSGAAGALAAVGNSLGANDPGFNGGVNQGGSDGGGGQRVPVPQYGNPGQQQQPIAVTGGS